MGKVAFSVGCIYFYWYGIIAAVSLLAWLVVTLRYVRLRQEPLEPVLDILLAAVPSALILARLNYVWLHWPLYAESPWTALYFWRGGLSAPGAVIGGLLAAYIVVRMAHLDLRQWLDIMSPGMALGQTILQWGDFVNQEAFGYPTSDPWGIYIDFAYRPSGFEQFDFFQPVFLYASGWNFLLFLVLCTVSWLHWRYSRIKSGTVFMLYVFLYSIGKFITESLVIGGSLTGELHFGQIFSLVMALISIVLAVKINSRPAIH